MSDMHFREPNQVKWQGSRPGHNGTQVLESFTTVAIATTPFYTVPVGHTLFLTNVAVSSSINVSSVLWVNIHTDAPAFWRTLLVGETIINADRMALVNQYWPPVEIPSGYIIYVHQTVNVNIRITIHGWYE